MYKLYTRTLRGIFSFASLLLLGVTADAGSLWREGYTDERGMFADKRARTVGDLVTIVVDEQVGSFNTLSLTTSKEADRSSQGLATNLINQFIGALPKIKGLPKQEKDITIPKMQDSGSVTFTGGGTITNNQTINARITVQVVDVLPNGNLVVEGLREVSFSKERQFATLQGVIRVYDIRADNTIPSSKVADAQIRIVSEGALTESQKKGWLSRINDKINPF